MWSGRRVWGHGGPARKRLAAQRPLPARPPTQGIPRERGDEESSPQEEDKGRGDTPALDKEGEGRRIGAGVRENIGG
ncbi:hypothetical protein GUJ93_ZPchr0012g21487 [Zizania palustris]|uniref:Uncharacterized protein n=1 Tax=Zizania palustris TaxID=103762 RepID=A0A8J5WRW4_ZIZPA|nr:hypothetical protein GUJ93_ZPchr0012g21487 [Zizania palustris]